jgi:hypothetical protein
MCLPPEYRRAAAICVSESGRNRRLDGVRLAAVEPIPFEKGERKYE